jgi:C1A family cysteine protease
MTKIENQGQIGSCVANAVAGAYEYLVKRHRGESYDVSRLFIYYNARSLSGIAHVDNGTHVRDAIESLKLHGACSERTYPYIHELVNQKPHEEAYQEAASFLVHSVDKIETRLETWKTRLAEGHPIIFALLLFDSFDNYNQNGLIPMPSSKDHKRNSHSAHAMLCVGYSEPDRVFIVRNSWGKNWGKDGYCYIPYDYLINQNYNLEDNWIIKRLDNFADNKDEYWSYNENSIFDNINISTRKSFLDIFRISNLTFWILLAALLLFSFVQMKFPFFDEEVIKERFKIVEQTDDSDDEIVKEDDENSENKTEEENKEKKEDKENKEENLKYYTWKWTNPYTNSPEELKFSVKDIDYKKSIKNRQALIFNSENQVYSSLSSNDELFLESFILAVKEHCKSKKLDYRESLDYIIGAIQAIPYTLVTMGNKDRCPCTLSFGSFLDDCSARNDRKGCCNDIEPFAVFSPIEFAVQKTGDCDTRTLFAYTVLNAMNYDVTILNSREEGHSIFGVYSPKPLGAGAYVLGKNRRKYYIWELTSISPPGNYIYKSSIKTWNSIMR